MSKYDSALNEIDKIHNMFRGVKDVKDALENIKGFENAEKEISERIEKLKSEEGKLQGRKNELLNEAVKNRDASAQVLLEAQVSAKKVVDDAMGKAAGILETANEQKAKSEKLVRDAESRLVDLTAQAKNKERSLADTSAKLADLKASAASLAV